MIRKLPLKLTCAVLVFFTSMSTIISAQVSLREISLKEQINNSSLVVEGEVIEQRSFWDEKKEVIYTAYTINVYKVFKGEPISQIEVLTMGGMVGLKGLFVSHALRLGKGSIGIFTLYDSNFNVGAINKTKNKQFRAYSGIQGFYVYDLEGDTALNPFSKRKGIKTALYKDLLEITKKSYKTVALFNTESMQKKSTQKSSSGRPPTQITFSPTTISAGTGSILTIEGSGFGNTQGKVGFRDSDANGAPFFDALDSHITSWSDEMITVEVPVIASPNNSSINGTAGTGNIRVTNSGGSSNTSSAELIISYAEINGTGSFGEGLRSYQTQHYNDNSSGGYTWVMEQDFFMESTHTGAPDAFLRALESWRCETKVNWEVSDAFTTTDVITTAENIVTFDVDGTSSELPAGILGTCSYGFSGSNCTSGIVFYVTDLDIVFDRETNWYFGTGSITGKHDFETVALHELGHGHQLAHVINPNNVMHRSISSGIINTALDINSIAAANDVHSRSTFNHDCNPGIIPMTDYAGNCSLSTEDFNLESGVTLFPNPAKQQLFIKNISPESVERVVIFDVSGRLILDVDVSYASKTKTINLENTSKGLYFVNLHSGLNLITKKLIIE